MRERVVDYLLFPPSILVFSYSAKRIEASIELTLALTQSDPARLTRQNKTKANKLSRRQTNTNTNTSRTRHLMSSVRISPRELETKGGAEATAATLVGAREESLAGDGAPFNGSAATRNVDETEEEQTPLSIHVGKGGLAGRRVL